MAQDGYSWWMGRIEYLCKVYDVLRIDHFRAFDEYYAIPFGSADASPGRWRTGPGKNFFRILKEKLGELPIIAEDLGFVTDSVRELLRDSGDGLTVSEVAEKSHLSDYAVKCLLEASLSIGTVLVNPATDRFTISKTGWFLLNDPATRVNIDFNHDVNYEGWFHLEESLKEGKPIGLRHFGSWPTIYAGLSSLPEHVQKSWFAFDHFYSDSSFPEALRIVFDEHKVRTLYDVGGNTGKWALRCVDYSVGAEVTVLDLPQQIALMEENVRGKKGAERIKGYGIDLLDERQSFPMMSGGPDAIWMSQFLDCFSMEQIVSILRRAAAGEHITL